jgi:hypothetical protein
MELKLHGTLSIKDAKGGIMLEFDATGGKGGSIVIPREEFKACASIRSWRDMLLPKVVEPAPAKEEDKGWVRSMYDLTTLFHKKTGLKCAMTDIYEAFFVDSIKDVDEGDRESFERLLRERLEKLSPGWDAI